MENSSVPGEIVAEVVNRQKFQKNLRLLDRTIFWSLWSSVFMILLLAGSIVLLSLSRPLAPLGPFHGLNVSLLVRVLLGLVSLISVVRLGQRRHLKLIRSRLVAEMEAATKERVRAEKLYGMAILDPLTGLYNRRYGETRLQEEITQAEKSGDPLLVLALDLDRFKEINDQHGHDGGDLALKTFSRRLRRAIRACDVPIRVGGDEFLVILPECPPDKAQVILSRLDSFELKLSRERIPVCFSVGVAQYQPGDTPETMIKRADQRLYAEKAKRAGVAV